MFINYLSFFAFGFILGYVIGKEGGQNGRFKK